MILTCSVLKRWSSEVAAARGTTWRNVLLYIYQLSKIFVNPWCWAVDSIHSFKILRGHSNLHFIHTVNFANFLNNLCCSRAMTEFWGPKTSYANACHSYGHIGRAYVIAGSCLIGSINLVTNVMLFLTLWIFSFVRPLFVLVDVPKLKYMRFIYIFCHWAQEWGFLMLSFLCSW